MNCPYCNESLHMSDEVYAEQLQIICCEYCLDCYIDIWTDARRTFLGNLYGEVIR